MATINRMSQLLNTLRQQLVSQSQAKRVAAQPGSSTEEWANEPRLTVEELKQRLGEELKRFDLKTAAGKKQARHSFIESVLAWDMGGQILQDRRFSLIVKDVEESMSTNPSVLTTLDQLLLDLQSHKSLST